METAADRVKRIALCGVLSALSVSVLWLGSMLPGYAVTAAAVAGLLSAVAVLRAGIGAGMAVYVVSALLALLLLPQKSAALWYAVFFGHYAMLKSVLERLRSRVLEWSFKLLAVSAAFFALQFLFRTAFAALSNLVPFGPVPLYLITLVVFVLYDIGFSRLIGLYLRRVGRNSGKGV